LLLNDLPRQQAVAKEHQQWQELAARLEQIKRQPFNGQQYLAALREQAALAQGQQTPGTPPSTTAVATAGDPIASSPPTVPPIRLSARAAGRRPELVELCHSCQYAERL
jgi:hypothetical protein